VPGVFELRRVGYSHPTKAAVLSEPPRGRRTEMDFGALMFFTDYAISAVDLAKPP
jgi:hypothetical protein